jgi:hypothetical protein
MSHSRPIPEASVSPYPLHPAPLHRADDDETRDPSAEANMVVAKPENGLSNRTIGLAAGAFAIGSAAIAAALLFYNRPTKAVPTSKPAKPRSPRGTQSRSTRGSTAKSH